MAGVVDGRPVNAAYTNSVLMAKDGDNDVTGYISTSKFFATLLSSVASAATINALATASGLVSITGSTATTLNGIAGQQDGKRFTLYNGSSLNITVNNNSGSVATGQKIATPGGFTITLLPGRTLDFIYDIFLGFWIIEGGTGIQNSTPTQSSTSISNNTTGNVTGLLFVATTQFSATVPYNVLRGTAMETGLLTISYNGVTWTCQKAWYAGNAGIDFSITTGQVTYTTDNSSSGTMQYSFDTLGA